MKHINKRRTAGQDLARAQYEKLAEVAEAVNRNHKAILGISELIGASADQIHERAFDDGYETALAAIATELLRLVEILDSSREDAAKVAAASKYVAMVCRRYSIEKRSSAAGVPFDPATMVAIGSEQGKAQGLVGSSVSPATLVAGRIVRCERVVVTVAGGSM